MRQHCEEGGTATSTACSAKGVYGRYIGSVLVEVVNPTKWLQKVREREDRADGSSCIFDARLMGRDCSEVSIPLKQVHVPGCGRDAVGMRSACGRDVTPRAMWHFRRQPRLTGGDYWLGAASVRPAMNDTSCQHCLEPTLAWRVADSGIVCSAVS